MNDAVNALFDGDSVEKVAIANETLEYSDLVNLWASLNPYKLSTMIMTGNTMVKLLNMDEFKDSNAGLNFHGTGNLITPFGTEVLRFDDWDDDVVIGIDKNYALEKVQAGDVVTDYDKLIDRQLERATITTITGFSPIFNDACKLLTND
jgi:hypothetical protein